MQMRSRLATGRRGPSAYRVHLPQDAFRVLQEDRAALGRADAAARALEDLEAERVFHIVQDAAQVRLADKQIFRGL